MKEGLLTWLQESYVSYLLCMTGKGKEFKGLNPRIGLRSILRCRQFQYWDASKSVSYYSRARTEAT